MQSLVAMTMILTMMCKHYPRPCHDSPADRRTNKQTDRGRTIWPNEKSTVWIIEQMTFSSHFIEKESYDIAALNTVEVKGTYSYWVAKARSNHAYRIWIREWLFVPENLTVILRRHGINRIYYLYPSNDFMWLHEWIKLKQEWKFNW